ncbi:MAG: carboxypeptidase regulatory-like domain-containing protein, partial [Bryobacteraceae bacterium]|nr:carboxypeptidase regulatory-like domain-containing protein [Bryobacteraceae bacterium]
MAVSSLCRAALAVCALAFVTSTALAQEVSAGITGRITDPSGAAVVGAVVTAKDVNRGTVWPTKTNEEGIYAFPRIPVGTYELKVEATGFKTATRPNIVLELNQRARLDITLEIGTVTETVEVTGAAPLLNTDTTIVGATLTPTTLTKTPLISRNFISLTLLAPGVTTTNPAAFNNGVRTSGGGRPYVNGNRKEANNFLLDGIDNNHTSDNLTAYQPNLDAIQEVRMITNNASAEFGNFQGGVINVIIKSGTNELHGNVFHFFRNDKLDSRNFFATTKPKNRYNNFGGTVGGPIRRDKVFFFLSNEYRRIIQSTGTRTAIVPTPEQIAGDFSGGRTISDPDTRQPFPNNRIPASLLDPNAQILLKNYYAPPTPGFRQGALNFSSSAPDGTKYRSGLGRLDYNVSPTLTVFGRYNIDSTRLESPFGLFASNAMPGVAASEQAHIMYTANGSVNWTVRPNLLNQFTTAWYHGSMAISTVPFASRTRVAGFNVPRIFDTVTDSSGLIPAISMAQGYAGIQILWPQNISHYTYELIDNVSYIRGRHILKFGGSIDKENKTQNQSNPNNNGTFTFNGSATGDALADLVVGRAFQYTENSQHIMGSSRLMNVGLYLQDQWRVHPRLSLTLGLRWEFFQPEQDRNGTYSFFHPPSFNPARAPVVQPNGQITPGTENFANGVLVVGKDALFGYAVTNTVYDTFAPRAGFSYALTRDNRTVLRGGFGMFHDRWSQFVSTLRNNYPFNQSVSIFNTYFSNPAQGTRRVFPIGMTSFNSPWEIPYMMKWSFGVQRQLPAELLLDVSYVGSRGVQLVYS